ncbi:hypothetical protein GA0070621_2002 [Micromonospora narathiwatensis]|uniref:Uncharacterized protein n=1 Tax=Micromonospora narathiwatensis TaxID=299146 RepID=A0A1A8ZK40_9ACTN|nr:hypothetical protein GA0070621_2002 [Micromonospora narathiwatensis]
MDAATVDPDYQVAGFEEDDDPESLIGDEIDYHLPTGEEQ